MTATFSLFRLFNPSNARAKEGSIGVSLKDIKVDKYGRAVVKHPNDGDLSFAADDYAQDLICPCPKPPDPPWPVPDLICPCPKPPKPPSKS